MAHGLPVLQPQTLRQPEAVQALADLQPDVIVVAESGISRPRHLRRLQAAGLDAFLIGTALMGPAHPRAVLSRLMERGRI